MTRPTVPAGRPAPAPAVPADPQNGRRKGVLAGLADAAAQASDALAWTGSYIAAFELADTALSRVTSLDHDNGGILALRFQRAIAARWLGHIDAAETELREILAGRQRILGADHPDTLTAEHYLAATTADRPPRRRRRHVPAGAGQETDRAGR